MEQGFVHCWSALRAIRSVSSSCLRDFCLFGCLANANSRLEQEWAKPRVKMAESRLQWAETELKRILEHIEDPKYSIA
jgi:hypothetical protein